ncbi:hypothetical protein F511_28987 [Dorcoceras hygrometricum]|uniref:Uncharacterized protein n=1 Tax=Dorcoceras hygrometricum TaxID=472368 RepID=A0A2Z7C3J5_9LAMI|nr:hypothetical protein F511_28987 [Dorcoceras hygrometricum]
MFVNCFAADPSLRLDILRLYFLRLDTVARDWLSFYITPASSFLVSGSKSTEYAKLATGFIATAGSLKLSTGCCCCLRLVVQLHLLVNSSLRLDFLLYDVASSCDWMYKLPADSCDCSLKPSAEYDDVTNDVINAKPSADSPARQQENDIRTATEESVYRYPLLKRWEYILFEYSA